MSFYWVVRNWGWGERKGEEKIKRAKWEAKEARVKAKSIAYKNMHIRLNIKQGGNGIYKLAKANERRKRIVRNVRYTKDDNCGILVKCEDI